MSLFSCYKKTAKYEKLGKYSIYYDLDESTAIANLVQK